MLVVSGRAPLAQSRALLPDTQGRTPAPPGTAQDDLLPRVGISGETSIALSEAIEQALANNPDIAMARVSVEQATNDIAAADGGFDPQFNLQTSFQRQVLPVSSLIGGAASGKVTQEGLLLGPEVRGLLPSFGTRYQLNFTSRRQTSDNQFVTLNPQFPSELSVSVTQPLFRGRRVDETRRQVEVAKQNQALTDEQFRQQVMDLTLQTELAYWELAFAEQNLQVQQQGLELARDQVASNQRLVGQGVAAPIDVLEAETQVATFRQSVYTAQAALARAEHALKALILPNRSSPLWSAALRPTTTSGVEPAVYSLDEAIRLAHENRPELAQTKIAASVNEADTRFFRDQRQTQVDLVGTYLSSGLAGRLIPAGPNPFTSGFLPLFDRINALSGLQGLPPLGGFDFGSGSTVPPGLTGGLGQSLSSLATQDFPTVEIGLRISLPFRNRTAEARVATSVAEGRRIRLRAQQLEQAVEADVRDALQAVASSRAARDAALQTRSLAEAQYESEQRRFEAGTSTVFLVLQRQTAMIATRTQSARAEADVSRSIAQLQRATGQTLTVHQIALQP
jgi:outer membrane protein TolC